ncbi:uncharacterized protein HD556DRAFT_1361804 [Suillus plorans]|uniref:Uncharacterized protein n=1 Tax=Suillus plorans TaxID=116603 RepID=A0A9P7AU92_9AGAM|nr:uncharacterized protein HD556DRAFT_1361804 [Suillus plorans]KAG1795935.1 hypothetical protein HD556DRAFT_1361804 [Suillus plorans]
MCFYWQSAARAEDGFRSYRCVVLRRITVVWYIFTSCLTAILFHPDVQMTLITIFLHSSYLVFVYVFVFLSTRMLSSRFLYTTSLV